MNTIDLLRRLHHHRMWVNRNLLQAAAELTDEQLRHPFAIGQGSVWKSLVHLHAAEYVWLAALLGDEDPVLPGDVRGKLPGNQLGEGGFTSLGDLDQKWRQLDDRWNAYLSTLSPNQLTDTVYKISSSSTIGRLGAARSDVLLHICTHAQYTSAQIVNMLRQLGVEKLPATMLISLVLQETRPDLS